MKSQKKHVSGVSASVYVFLKEDILLIFGTTNNIQDFLDSDS